MTNYNANLITEDTHTNNGQYLTYISGNALVPTRSWHYYPRAAGEAIGLSIEAKGLPTYITDINLATLAIYINGQRVYHFSEAPEFLLNADGSVWHGKVL
jgi:hypothetical protein